MSTRTFAEMVREANDLIKPVNKNQGKGLIARCVARKILSTKPTHCPDFIRRIAEVVNEELGFGVVDSGDDEASLDEQDVPF